MVARGVRVADVIAGGFRRRPTHSEGDRKCSPGEHVDTSDLVVIQSLVGSTESRQSLVLASLSLSEALPASQEPDP